MGGGGAGEVTAALLSSQDFIQANLRPYFTWMGLSDQDGVWKWVDGSDYETNIK